MSVEKIDMCSIKTIDIEYSIVRMISIDAARR